MSSHPLKVNHLVIVCGHGIWLGGAKKGWDESEWLIESYKAGETPTFIEHIKAGIRVLTHDNRAVLVFSGGPTWKETKLSEATSYYNLATANEYFGLLPDSQELAEAGRILVEERALDSYYNILFSLVLFWRTHAVWPEHVTIVSHAFKKARLVDGHCAAIGFPLDRVDFIGINPPGIEETPAPDQGGNGGLALSEHAASVKAAVMTGVSQTLDDWVKDPHGVGEVLAGKRRKRNPWSIDQRLFVNDNERRQSGVQTRILDDGTEALADGKVQPWAQ
ncbi:hypothetical protein DL546_002845 [Coniochaeta pulveracea]|uniref:Uncharacterized protein n=1 Tax=Coniochaeta pulveracea TaxID=177199 RepID=A0A420Y934_9PEZI|nr:hypothetical protein DL546_002845 [Coniochaeta pulveracea]